MRLATILLISFFINYKALAETYFPSDTWETRTADDVNLNNNQIDKLFKLTFNDHATMGAVLIKDGYIVKEQYANGFDQKLIWHLMVYSEKFLCSINWYFN